jgi:hypothetical protein
VFGLGDGPESEPSLLVALPKVVSQCTHPATSLTPVLPFAPSPPQGESPNGSLRDDLRTVRYLAIPLLIVARMGGPAGKVKSIQVQTDTKYFTCLSSSNCTVWIGATSLQLQPGQATLLGSHESGRPSSSPPSSCPR